jgi:hypothetical protein
MSFVSVVVKGLDGIITKHRTNHRSIRKVRLSFMPLHTTLRSTELSTQGSTFWSESDLSRTTRGRWIHDMVRTHSQHVAYLLSRELRFNVQ